MKSVLISIRPQWCEKIASGEKTIEVRKTRPKLETPFKCYIYRTKGSVKHLINDKWVNMAVGGNVIGEFVCDSIFPIKVFDNGSIQNYYFYGMEKSCLSFDEIANYIGYGKAGYGWHIFNLKVYDKPKGLSEFGLNRAPQSWCYVEGGEG